MRLTFLNTPVNTGALCQLQRRGRTLSVVVVEVSAASHVAPVYPNSAEAPRCYGRGPGAVSLAQKRRAWIAWAYRVMGGAPRGADDHGEWELARRLWINANLNLLPDTGRRKTHGGGGARARRKARRAVS